MFTVHVLQGKAVDMIFEVRKNFIAESNDRRTEKVSSVGIESIYVAVVKKRRRKKKETNAR